MNKTFLLMPVLSILIFSSCAKEVDRAAELEGLLQTDREFAERSREFGPAEAFYAYLADDALQLPNGGNPIRSAEAIRDSMSGGNNDLLWEPETGEVSSSGDFGYTWGNYEAIFKDDEGNETVSRGKYLNVWRKDSEGSWKVVVDIGNKNP